MSLALFHRLFWEGAGVVAPAPAPAAPYPQGGILPLGRVHKRKAPPPVVPYHVPVDSASDAGLVRALWHVAEAVPTPQPYAPVAEAQPPRRVRATLAIRTRRRPVDVQATAPPAAPPERRRRKREYVPVPLPEPAHPEVPAEPRPEPVQPAAPPPLPPEERAPPVPFPPDAAEAARVAAAIAEVTAAPAAVILPAVPRALPWDEEEADTVALLLGLLLEEV